MPENPEKASKQESRKPDGNAKHHLRRYRRERRQFKSLLLANPNYFGNLKASPFEPVLQIQGNTRYEEIGCVGFQPQFDRLEAVVFVNQPTGYGGDVCSAGTPEYVRFYLSWDGGTTWVDQGVSSFTAFNIPETDHCRLEYAVSREINPPKKKFCSVANIVLARAILSWNVEPPPNDPSFTPVWGNVHDTRIMVDPFQLKIPIDDFLLAAGVELSPELAAQVDVAQEMPLAAPKKLSLGELESLYQDTNVEPHRFALAEVHKLLSQPGATLLAPGSKAAFEDFGFDLPDILDQLEPTDGSTAYEELECVGLNPNQDQLVGALRVKLPSGYSGNPCTAGSTEYVTFWADFDGNGSFETCLGTASVTVYDVASLPEEGLEYAVFLPVNLNAYRQPCQDGPVVVRIRAILSWQVAPPCGDPDYVPVWGNREETSIHIRPGIPWLEGDFEPLLENVCGYYVCDIDQTTGWAPGDKPFGKTLTIAGRIPAALALGVPDTLQYKVYVRPLDDLGNPIGAGTWQPLSSSFSISVTEDTGAGPVGYNLTQDVDANGRYTYRGYGSAPGAWRYVNGDLLAKWHTTSAETGLWEIRVEAFDTSTSPDTLSAADVIDCLADGTTRQDLKVRLDQTKPVPALAITGFSRNGGPVQAAVDCDTFQVGDVIHGTYSATDAPDDHFRRLRLTVEPADAANGATVSPPSRVYGAPDFVPGSGEAGTWTLDTAPMDPCGYTVRLVAWDRTIVSCDADGWWDDDFVGFCLEAAPA